MAEDEVTNQLETCLILNAIIDLMVAAISDVIHEALNLHS
jgi:hypothetical protein